MRSSRFFLAAVLLAAGSGAGAAAPCEDLLPIAAATGTATRQLQAEDLVLLRDFGRPEDAVTATSPFSLSPDGTRIALQLRRGNLDAETPVNSHCLGMMVMELRPDAVPLLVDRGGELVTNVSGITGYAAFPSGVPSVVVPHWSPDGTEIAWLRRDGGVTQAWRARADGSGSQAATHSGVDVESLAWSTDGKALLFQSRPGLETARQQIDREEREGFLYDTRFRPIASNRPFPAGPIAAEYFAVELTSGQLRAATPDERRLLDPSLDTSRPQGAIAWAVGNGKRRAWTAPREPARYLSPTALHATAADGAEHACTEAVCTEIVDLWWTPDGSGLRFLRREGWGWRQLAMYSWVPGGAAPYRTFATDDLLSGCQAVGSELLCAHEAATLPRRLVLLDPETGSMRRLFDPNPEFASVKLGQVERLNWKTAFGAETYGDLVLPPDHRPGQRHPLIVVQYRSRGFLRGGTGDEYPIHLFATRGFAVLSVERPRFPAFSKPVRNSIEANAVNLKDFADRRSVQSSLEAGVRMAVARGVADPTRVGGTGLSDGAAAIIYGLVNSKLFSAVALSSCCEESLMTSVLVGPAHAAFQKSIGFPSTSQDNPEFWKRYSLAQNVGSIDVPILLQLPESEYLIGLQTYWTFRQRNRPIEMYVFEGERHIKWQPVHRLAVYQRNLDWFDFWLQDRVDPDPHKAAQYTRWRELRDASRKRPG